MPKHSPERFCGSIQYTQMIASCCLCVFPTSSERDGRLRGSQLQCQPGRPPPPGAPPHSPCPRRRPSGGNSLHITPTSEDHDGRARAVACGARPDATTHPGRAGETAAAREDDARWRLGGGEGGRPPPLPPPLPKWRKHISATPRRASEGQTKTAPCRKADPRRIRARAPRREGRAESRCEAVRLLLWVGRAPGERRRRGEEEEAPPHPPHSLHRNIASPPHRASARRSRGPCARARHGGRGRRTRAAKR